MNDTKHDYNIGVKVTETYTRHLPDRHAYIRNAIILLEYSEANMSSSVNKMCKFCFKLSKLVDAVILTPSNHIAKITAIAYQRFNILLRSFTSRGVAILVKAFVTYVRQLLEYNTVVWSPHLKGDIHTIENVQRRFTKRLPG